MIQILIVLASFVAGALCAVLFFKWVVRQRLRSEVLDRLNLYKLVAEEFPRCAKRKEIEKLIKADGILKYLFWRSAVVSIIYGVLIIALLAISVYGAQ